MLVYQRVRERMWPYFATLQMLKIIPRKHHGLVDFAFRYAERCQRAFQRLQAETLLDFAPAKSTCFFGISGECWNLQMLQIPWVISHVPMFHITQPLGIYGLYMVYKCL